MGKKKAGRKENPKVREIVTGGNPDAFFDKTPSWAFRQGDAERWTIKKCSSNDFEIIIDRLCNFESQQKSITKDAPFYGSRKILEKFAHCLHIAKKKARYLLYVSGFIVIGGDGETRTRV